MKSNQHSFTFETWTKDHFQSRFQSREGEVRMGDLLSEQGWNPAKYVIIGIRECCGPLANNGRSGAQFAFPAFIKAFLNTQVHDAYPSSDLCILGEIIETTGTEGTLNNHEKVAELDVFLEQILIENIKPGQIPIVVGGGHNNALALIRWSSKNKKTAVINLDAHADLRSTELRHSGNSFSTALEEGTLFHYSVFGLHEAYNNSFIREALKNDQIFHSFYEAYLMGERLLSDDLMNVLRHFHTDTKIGLEIDMDAIAYMPSSALSPSGWTLDQVRAFVRQFKQATKHRAYLNLTESAPQSEQESLIVGKALSYLVRDFTA